MDTASTGSKTARELKVAAPSAELKTSDLRGRAPVGADELIRAAESLDASELLGQNRALGAVQLAIGIDAPGYNAFISGLGTRNERESALRVVVDKAATMPS